MGLYFSRYVLDILELLIRCGSATSVSQWKGQAPSNFLVQEWITQQIPSGFLEDFKIAAGLQFKL